MAAPLEIIFTTKGVGTLLDRLKQVEAGFQKLDTSTAKTGAKALGLAAIDTTAAATQFKTAAAACAGIAANITQAAKLLTQAAAKPIKTAQAATSAPASVKAVEAAVINKTDTVSKTIERAANKADDADTKHANTPVTPSSPKAQSAPKTPAPKTPKALPVPKPPKPAKPPTIPAQFQFAPGTLGTLQRAQKMFAAAQATGDPNYAANAQAHLLAAQQAHTKATTPKPAKPPKAPPVPKTPKTPAVNPLLAYAPGTLGSVQRSQALLAQAQAGGNATHIANAQARLAQAQKTHKNASQHPVIKALKDAVMTSRVSFAPGGGGVMPLINRLVKVAGTLAPEVAAIIGIGTVAVAAAAALFELTQSAARAAEAFLRMELQLGSNGATTARLATIGNSVGLSPDAVASTAQNFQSRITSDPYAKAYAARFDIQNISGPYGNQDYGANLLKAADKLAAITDREERVRTARVLGLENLLPYAEQSKKQRGLEEKDALVKQGIFDPKMTQEAADFTAAISRIGDAISNLLGATGKPFIATLTDWINDLADGINLAADIVNTYIAPTIKGIIETISAINQFSPEGSIYAMAHGRNPIEEAMKHFKAAQEGFGDFGKDNKAALENSLNENTEAHDRNTREMHALNGHFGRGARLSGAIPAGMSGEFLRRSLEQGGIRLQSF